MVGASPPNKLPPINIPKKLFAVANIAGGFVHDPSRYGPGRYRDMYAVVHQLRRRCQELFTQLHMR